MTWNRSTMGNAANLITVTVKQNGEVRGSANVEPSATVAQALEKISNTLDDLGIEQFTVHGANGSLVDETDAGKAVSTFGDLTVTAKVQAG